MSAEGVDQKDFFPNMFVKLSIFIILKGKRNAQIDKHVLHKQVWHSPPLIPCYHVWIFYVSLHLYLFNTKSPLRALIQITISDSTFQFLFSLF